MSVRLRFYKDVSVGIPPTPEREGLHRVDWGYSILLDRKPLKTPAGAPLLLPTSALANAVAEEWRRQEEKIHPAGMHLTRLANTAIDRVAPDRGPVEHEILTIAKSDVVCYRADAPAALASLQSDVWDPLLDWAQDTHGIALTSGVGVGFIEQSAAAMDALQQFLSQRCTFELTALAAAASLCSSAIIAIALADVWVTAEEGFSASNLDADFQAERWGRDAEADAQRTARKDELSEAVHFMRLAAQHRTRRRAK